VADLRDVVNADEVREARAWLADCFDDYDDDEISDREVVRGIERHYEGGIAQFLQDGRNEA
jgi:hypothetical protein